MARTPAQHLMAFYTQDDGVTMPEYALMLALIALVCFTAVGVVGTRVKALFNNATLTSTLGG